MFERIMDYLIVLAYCVIGLILIFNPENNEKLVTITIGFIALGCAKIFHKFNLEDKWKM